MQSKIKDITNNVESESLSRYTDPQTRHSGGFLDFWKDIAKQLVKEEMSNKPLTLYDAGGNPEGTWYFNLYAPHPVTGEIKRLKPTFNINRIKGADKRYRFAEKFMEKFNKALKDDKVDFSKFFDVPAAKEPTVKLLDLLPNIVTKITKGKNHRTKDQYTLYVNRLRWYLEFIEQLDISPNKFTPDNAQDFQDYLVEERELSARSINATVQKITQFFGDKSIKKLVAFNPFIEVKKVPEKRSFKYMPFSEEEKIAIATKLKQEAPHLYLLSQFVYNCFIRPQEACCIYRRDIDFKTRFISINYMVQKTSNTSFREIPEALYDLLIEMGVDKMPLDTLVFEPIAGNHPRPDLRRKKVTELWNKLIIATPKERGLGINNNLYALKHTGNIDYIINNPNYDLAWLQQQNGHKNIEMTQKYLRDLPIQRLAKSKSTVRLFGQPAS
jgi:integrase